MLSTPSINVQCFGFQQGGGRGSRDTVQTWDIWCYYRIVYCSTRIHRISEKYSCQNIFLNSRAVVTQIIRNVNVFMHQNDLFDDNSYKSCSMSWPSWCQIAVGGGGRGSSSGPKHAISTGFPFHTFFHVINIPTKNASNTC